MRNPAHTSRRRDYVTHFHLCGSLAALAPRYMWTSLTPSLTPPPVTAMRSDQRARRSDTVSATLGAAEEQITDADAPELRGFKDGAVRSLLLSFFSHCRSVAWRDECDCSQTVEQMGCCSSPLPVTHWKSLHGRRTAQYFSRLVEETPVPSVCFRCNSQFVSIFFLW